MTKETTGQMKQHTFSAKDPSLLLLLQDFETSRNDCNINEGATMQAFTHYRTGAVEAVIKARVAPPTETAKTKEGCLTSFSSIVNYLLERFSMEDKILPVDADIRNPHARELDNNWLLAATMKGNFKALFRLQRDASERTFVKHLRHFMCRTPRRSWSENRQASLKDLAQKAA